MDSFETYRRAKAFYGGRPGQNTDLQGWFVVAGLLIATIIAWMFAFQGYQVDGGVDDLALEEAFAEATIPLEPGLLITDREPHEMSVVFLDVGQGDAIFIQTPAGDNILIDAGEGGEPDFEMAREVHAGERLILPFFARNNIEHLDYFIATHPHSDHIGGAEAIFDAIEVKELWISGADHATASNEAMLEAAERQGTTVRAPEDAGGDLRAGTPLNIGGGARAWLLYTNPNAPDVNDSSLTVLFYYGDNSLLVTGDLEFDGEEQVIQQWGHQINVDILKVAHHGSVNTSTAMPWARITSPEHSVFTVGAYNTYGHPSPEVIDRLREVGSEIHRTDEDGTIFAFMDGQNIRWEHRRDLGVKID